MEDKIQWDLENHCKRNNATSGILLTDKKINWNIAVNSHNNTYSCMQQCYTRDKET